jgi:predicted nucleic acid-binding protein
LATILFASASLGGGCSAGVYQQIEKICKNSFISIAISHKCAVLTANLKHFERIRDLKSISWL